MPRRFVRVALLAVCVGATGCARLRPPAEAPAYFTQVTNRGWLYAHNWAEVPCFSLELFGETWRLLQSNPSKVDWARGDEFLSIVFSDNRRLGFAVAQMLPEDVMRAYLGYEAEHIRPMFDYQVMGQPKFANEVDGLWMGWSWEGRGGKRRGAKSTVPADQKHVILSVWRDPYVISFDWGTRRLDAPSTPTLEMISMLETLEFHPDCFSARLPASWSAGGKPYAGTDFNERIGPDPSGDGFSPSSGGPRPRR
jgi:hypothetical protein